MGSNPGRGTYCCNGKSPNDFLSCVKYQVGQVPHDLDRIHDYDRELRNAISRLDTDSRLRAPDKELILSFLERINARNVSIGGRGKYVNILHTASVTLRVPWRLAKRKDMEDLMTKLADHEIVSVKTKIVVAARSAGIDPIDNVFFDLKDKSGFEKSAKQARALGFSGKQLVHPSQVRIAKVFSPSREELRWARKVLGAYNRSSRVGRGALALEGALVGSPPKAGEVDARRHTSTED